jgi:hypothetical protein
MSDRPTVLEETLSGLKQAATRLLATHKSVGIFFPLTTEMF